MDGVLAGGTFTRDFLTKWANSTSITVDIFPSNEVQQEAPHAPYLMGRQVLVT